MKKTLAILGLLVCTTGVVFADEVIADAPMAAPQQIEVQSQLDKQTFNKSKFNNNQYKPNFKNQKDNMKFDKSVNNRKFKDGQPPKFDKKGKPDFKAGRPVPKGDLSNRLLRHGDFKPHHKHHGQFDNRRAHRQNMNRSHKAKHNMKRYNNRKAYNRPVKRR